MFGSVECDRCGGEGNLVVLETVDGAHENVVRGAEAVDVLRSDEWDMTGTRNCPRCFGTGHLNRAEV